MTSPEKKSFLDFANDPPFIFLHILSIVPSPIRCTTLSNIRNLTGPENCGVVGVSDWSSCEEWCLSKVEFCEIVTKTISNKER